MIHSWLKKSVPTFTHTVLKMSDANKWHKLVTVIYQKHLAVSWASHKLKLGEIMSSSVVWILTDHLAIFRTTSTNTEGHAVVWDFETAISGRLVLDLADRNTVLRFLKNMYI